MLISGVNLFCHKNSLFIFLFKSEQGIGTGEIVEIQHLLKDFHPVNKDYLIIIFYIHESISYTYYVSARNVYVSQCVPEELWLGVEKAIKLELKPFMKLIDVSWVMQSRPSAINGLWGQTSQLCGISLINVPFFMALYNYPAPPCNRSKIQVMGEVLLTSPESLHSRNYFCTL